MLLLYIVLYFSFPSLLPFGKLPELFQTQASPSTSCLLASCHLLLSFSVSYKVWLVPLPLLSLEWHLAPCLPPPLPLSGSMLYYLYLLWFQIIGVPKLKRVAALAKAATVAICVDDPDNVRSLSQVAQTEGITLPCVVEVNVGQNRWESNFHVVE